MELLSRRDFCLSSGALCASAVVSPAAVLRNVLPAATTGYAFHQDFASFCNTYSETHLRAEWINARLEQTGVHADLAPVTPYPDPMEYIRKIHTQEHIDTIDRTWACDPFTLTIGEVARTAVGYALGAVQAVCEGTVRNAFCCIRPPGHHVQNEGELGYCCFANVVLAALFAREKYQLRRILIIDWDFHQGNGTHGFICGDDDILFFETYNPPMYSTECDDYIITGPDHSFPADARRINIQILSDDTDNDDFVRIFESKLVPAAERFQPELVLISCGFDLKKHDSHGTFNVTAKGVSRLTRIVRQIAETHAGGKLVSLLEGGYEDSERDKSISGDDPTFSGLAQCAENHVKTLITGDEHAETPYYSGVVHTGMYGQGVKLRNSAWPRGLSGEQGPWRITLTDCNGRVVKKVYHRCGRPLDFNRLNLPAGRYAVSISGKTGALYRSHLMCMP